MKNSNGRIIGIDVGGTNFRIGAVSAEGDVTQFRKIPADEVFSTEDALTDLLSYLTAYRAELAEDIDAVSIGFPATINRERTKVLQAPNLPFMENLPVVPVLSQKLGVPAFLERDVTVALCYDMAKYGIPREGITCGIYFGTGIGNAISVKRFVAAAVMWAVWRTWRGVNIWRTCRPQGIQIRPSANCFPSVGKMRICDSSWNAWHRRLPRKSIFSTQIMC